MSTIPMASTLTAELFGVRDFGAIFSTVFPAHQIGGFVGTWLGGKLFDVNRNYYAMWMLVVTLCFVGALLALLIRSDRPRPTQ